MVWNCNRNVPTRKLTFLQELGALAKAPQAVMGRDKTLDLLCPHP